MINYFLNEWYYFIIFLFLFLILKIIEFSKEEENETWTIKNKFGKIGDFIKFLNKNNWHKGKKI